MTDLAAIERAITELPADDLAAFRSWFEAFEAERFDRQIAEDVAAGRLDRFAAEALSDQENDATRPL